MTRFREPILLSFAALCLCGVSAARAAEPPPQPRTALKVDLRAAVAPFLNEHCVRCHGPEKQKADLALHALAGDLSGERLLWLSVLEQVASGEMPPGKEPRPPADQTTRVVDALRAALDVPAPAAGEPPAAPRTPREGNLVPHDALFAAPVAVVSEPAGSPARLWRLRPEAYSGLVKDVFRGRVDNLTQPFGVTTERGFKDYADLYFVDQATTEILVRNAEQIVALQTAHEVKDAKVIWKKDAARAFWPLFDPPDQSPTPEQLRAAIDAQFRLAVARGPTADEADALLALHEQSLKVGDRAGAARTMLAAVLLRPEAIFRLEAAAGTSVVRLPPREIARALSLALGDRRDGPLFAAADKGDLATPEQVAAHVRRMLDDPKGERPRLLKFFREYFEYDLAPDVFKDKPKELVHRPEVLVADTDRLVQHVLRQDKDVLAELLTTTKTFANYGEKEDKQTRAKVAVPRETPNRNNDPGRAGPHAAYGFKEWPAPQPAELPAGERAGILTQPSWLVAHSTNFDNDPVRRGRWVRERLLGGHVPQLPIGVAAQVPDEPERTLRDRLRVTRAAQCWQCHRKMDELGLAFERFDHFGRHRATESVLDSEATAAHVDKKGKPLGPVSKAVVLNAAGAIAGSGDPSLDGPVGDAVAMMHKLASSERVRQVFIRHSFRFFLGRNETAHDAATLQAADRAYVQSGGSFKALVASLLTSDAFLYRVPSSAAPATRTPAPARAHAPAAAADVPKVGSQMP